MHGRSHVVIGAGPVGRAVALQLADQSDSFVVVIDRSHSAFAVAQGVGGRIVYWCGFRQAVTAIAFVA
ncbi:NAD-binding protein [Mesorhizobium sp. AR02]|uniref:NAD-binding protein n=1 Tax=Mesorhizobium sp. AR02 TaxID=2865837 RepID=UPI003A5B9F4F